MMNLKTVGLFMCCFACPAGLGVHSAQAESLTLSTYYPSPSGAYARLRLVPMESEPAEDCDPGSFYTSKDDNVLRFCHGQPHAEEGRWRPMVPMAVERGTLRVREENIYPVKFAKPFTDIPLIQVYLVGKDPQNPGQENVMKVNYFNLTGISTEGFSVIHLGSKDDIVAQWVAIGN